MNKIGILFDIDELGGGLYGYKAYKILFEAVDNRRLAGCVLKDGDTRATLSGQANQYCIAIESDDLSKITLVKEILSKVNKKGLAPLSSRFIQSSEIDNEPLVFAGYMNSEGELTQCQTSWVMSAWRDSQRKF